MQSRFLGPNRYTDLWGYDVEMLRALMAKLNFTYETFSDPGFYWGGIRSARRQCGRQLFSMTMCSLCSEGEGVWTGITAYCETGFTDMIFGGFGLSDIHAMVMQPKTFHERDYLVQDQTLPCTLGGLIRK